MSRFPLGAWAGALFLAALGASSATLACGVCIEDKVAVTYDYDVVQRAAARHHLVVFAAVQTPADPEALRKAAARLAGVDRASVRAAASPAALSFALDPHAASPLAALAALERDPALGGVRLALIRVMR